MREFDFGAFCLRANVEANRAWYGANGTVTDCCGCAYCRNFAAAIEEAPRPGKDFLEKLGVNILHPADACECGPKPGRRRLYLPWYHAAGELVSEREREELILPEGCTALITRRTDLAAEDFPRPCFQVDLAFSLPWVLEDWEPGDWEPGDWNEEDLP